jgi:hypothetical protein
MSSAARHVNYPKDASDCSRSGLRLRPRSASPRRCPRRLVDGVEPRERLVATAIVVVLAAIVATAVGAALGRLLVL